VSGVTDFLTPLEDADAEFLRRDVRVLHRMVQVSLVLNSTLELDALLKFIMDVAAELTEAESASILLMDKNTHQLHFTASTGTDIKVLQKIPVPLDGSIAGATLTENRPIVIKDTKKDPRHYHEVGDAIRYDVRSLASVPMSIREQVIGVLQAVNKKPADVGFHDEDVRRLRILAALAAVAIENARLIEALQEALDDLDRLDKIKSDFIAIASHELRTPLGLILGYATFLKDDAQGEVSEHADAVLKSAMRMRNLIEDMANLTQIRAEDDELELKAVTVNSIMRSVQQDVAELADAKGQVFIVDVPVEQIEIMAERIRLEQALTNVLNNAVKFTPERGVITLKAQIKANEVWLIAEDSGIGLAADHLEHIFDQFYQVEDHMTRHHGGMGLGLTIAKAIVERHKGRIWAESKGPGQGSTFYISLPLAYPKS
jgi:signal transduction histidine kinase